MMNAEELLTEVNKRYKINRALLDKIDATTELVDKVVYGGAFIANTHITMFYLNELANQLNLPIIARGKEMEEEIKAILTIKGD